MSFYTGPPAVLVTDFLISYNPVETRKKLDNFLGKELCVTGVSSTDIVVILVLHHETIGHREQAYPTELR